MYILPTYFAACYFDTNVHNVPKTELLANNFSGDVSETVTTHCSPSSVVEHFQTSFM